MINCKKCGMLKLDLKSNCACNAKPFNAKKLSKKTRKEKKPTVIKKISEKKKQRLKNNGTEGQMFKNIYKKLLKQGLNKCLVCGMKMDGYEITPASFPHILPKGKFPEYRYFENNIGFVCGINHHDKFDEAVNNFKQDKGLAELEKIIKNGDVPDLSKYLDY